MVSRLSRASLRHMRKAIFRICLPLRRKQVIYIAQSRDLQELSCYVGESSPHSLPGMHGCSGTEWAR